MRGIEHLVTVSRQSNATAIVLTIDLTQDQGATSCLSLEANPPVSAVGGICIPSLQFSSQLSTVDGAIDVLLSAVTSLLPQCISLHVQINIPPAESVTVSRWSSNPNHTYCE